MAKARTPEEKIGFEGKSFTTIDGRELVLEDHFRPNDFAVNDKGEAFVTHAALVRVLKETFTILERHVFVHQPPAKGNEWCAVVEVSYRIQPRFEDGLPNPTAGNYFWSSVADCRVSNSMPGMERYTTTIAETRASGRVLRQVLGVDFCTKEELAEQTEDVIPDDSPATPSQLVPIEKKFMAGHGITLEQIKTIVGRDDFEVLENLTRREAANLIQKLHRQVDKLVKENKEGKKPSKKKKEA